MRNPQGRIISVDDSGASVVVEVEPGLVCERCASGKGCGAGLLGRAPGERQVTATVAAGLDVGDGDDVAIVLQPRNLLRAAFVVYGYPLLAAVAAAAAAFGMGFGDGAAAGTALAGIAVGFGMARLRLAQARCLRDFTPTVVEKLQKLQKQRKLPAS